MSRKTGGLTLSILFSLGCASLLKPPIRHWPIFPNGYFMHVGAFIQTTGTGNISRSGRTAKAAASLSRDEAILDAWDRLGAYLKSMPHPKVATVAYHPRMSSEYAQALADLVHTADIVSTHWSKDGTAVVVLRVSKDRINRVLGTEFE